LINVGILVHPERLLENWEIRIFEFLKNDSSINVRFLVYDNSGVSRSIKPSGFAYQFGLRVIKRIERPYVLSHLNEKQISACEIFPDAVLVGVSPEKSRYVDTVNLSANDYSLLSSCDLMIRHDFGILRGDILSVCKHGIWSFHHADNQVNRGGPAGFWEVYNSSSQSGVTLQRLNSDLDGGGVIKKGFFNTRKCWFENREFLLEASVEVFISAINALKSDSISVEPVRFYDGPLYRYPKFYQLMLYLLKSMCSILLLRLRRRFNKENYPLNKNKKVWTFGLLNFPNRRSLYKVREVNIPRDQFWADPFLFESKNGRSYVFFESYSYSKRYANISVGEIIDSTVGNVNVALDIGNHLSYPFLYEHNRSLYMLPESVSTKSLDIYRCEEFPDKWVKFRTLFSGVSMADPTLLEHDGYVWLFVNEAHSKFNDHNSCLYVYRFDGYDFCGLTPHKKNPVLINSDGARSAGPIYFDKELDAYVRPCQRNIRGVYGYGISLKKIVKLNIDDYLEEDISVVGPNFIEDIIGVHHIDVGTNYTALDFCKKRRR
jgi:hypothetical protein